MPGDILLENGSTKSEKISGMAALGQAIAGSFVPVVQPGDTVNYRSPLSQLLSIDDNVYITGNNVSVGTNGGGAAQVAVQSTGQSFLSGGNGCVINMPAPGAGLVDGIELLLQGGLSLTISQSPGSQVFLKSAPNADPHKPGALWVDATAGYVVKQSQG